MNENSLLHMLANPKKFKKIQEDNNKSDSESNSDSESDTNSKSLINNYSFDTNPLCDTEITPEYSEELKELIGNLDNIDNYLLNNKFNDNFEIIQNYLIDLLFLIKSKKT